MKVVREYMREASCDDNMKKIDMGVCCRWSEMICAPHTCRREWWYTWTINNMKKYVELLTQCRSDLTIIYRRKMKISEMMNDNDDTTTMQWKCDIENGNQEENTLDKVYSYSRNDTAFVITMIIVDIVWVWGKRGDTTQQRYKYNVITPTSNRTHNLTIPSLACHVRAYLPVEKVAEGLSVWYGEEMMKNEGKSGWWSQHQQKIIILEVEEVMKEEFDENEWNEIIWYVKSMKTIESRRII